MPTPTALCGTVVPEAAINAFVVVPVAGHSALIRAQPLIRTRSSNTCWLPATNVPRCGAFAGCSGSVATRLPIGWKKKAAQLPPLAATVVPAKRGDKLEMDELWSFVQKKANKHWIWLVVCRRTRQVVAAAMGARDEPTCRRLWNRIPEAYRGKYVYTDFYTTYFCVVPEKQHRPSEKGTGQTNKVERFNLTLRQRLGRFVRKTLSFSKSSRMHWYALLLFLHEYNCHCCERFKLTADPASST